MRAPGSPLKLASAFVVAALPVVGLFVAMSHSSPHHYGLLLWGVVAAYLGATVPCLAYSALDYWRIGVKNAGNRWPTRRELRRIGWTVFGIVTLVTSPTILQIHLAGVMPSDLLRGADTRHGLILAAEVVAMLIVGDLLTYGEHYVMHRSRWLMRNVHRTHHVFDRPTTRHDICLFSWAGIWVHPIEALTFLVSMIAVPCLLMLSGLYTVHPVSFALYMFLYVALVVDEHSGFDFSWSPSRLLPFTQMASSVSHEIHHFTPKQNLGFVLTTWDRLMGTNVLPERSRVSNARGMARRPARSC